MRALVALLLFLVGSLGLVGCETSSQPKALFSMGKVEEQPEDKGALLSRIAVQVDASILVPGKAIKVNFPLPERVVSLALEPLSAEDLALSKESAAWKGTTDEGGEAFVMRIGRAVEANFQLKSRSYRLRTIKGTQGVLEIYDLDRFREHKDDGVVDPNPPRDHGDVRGDSTCEDPSNRVDVMVLYTPAARDASGGVSAVENEIAFAVGRTNFAYANSNVAHRLNLIYAGLASYTEASSGVDSNALLGEVADTNDGVLDAIHGIRDGARADLVSLIYEVDDSTWCGWGQLQETANADTTDHRAFSVVQRSCAGVNLSFAHEVGHNLGAEHDRANANTAGLNFNFGHIQPVPSDAAVNPWRTVMSYNSPCKDSSATGSCPRVAWFSNPDVSRSGDATGVPLTSADPEHNVNVFAQNDAAVSRYRCLRSDANANVWMKDRWEDQGREPDPDTAGKPMWQSPYIWVRLAEDTNLEHEHEHENPVLGQTNHVYVKLNNTGGQSETGDVELYFASASTNLNDPASWTQISTQNLDADGVKVAHFPWNNLPGAGHYCLLARWNTDGTPLAFTNVGGAVRASNDLIWRNVNIVDLGGAPDSDSAFEMAGDRRNRETFLFIQTRPKSSRKIPWPDIARVRIRVDPAVLTGPKTRVIGMHQTDQSTFDVPLNMKGKLLGPFVLKAGEKTQVKLRIHADPVQVKSASAVLANPADFEFTATQIQAAGVELALEDPEALFANDALVVGGVTTILRLPSGQ